MTGETSSTGLPTSGAAQPASAEAPSCLPVAEREARPPKPTKPDPDRVRLCIVTRTERRPDELIRFVAGPDGQIVPDLARKLPGRGTWVTATHDAVATAVKRGLFSKSLKQQVKSDKDLPGQVDRLLAGETRQILSLANKAGLVVTGFSKVEAAIEGGHAVALISASDAKADGAGKLARKFKAIRDAARLDAPVIRDLTSDELGLAIGGSNVIHAVVTKGRLGARFISSCQRLRLYRMNSEGQELQSMGIAAAGTGAAAAPPLDDQLPDGSEQPGTEISSRIVTRSDQAGTDHE